ncbi:Hypothetical predicted protein [Olea europaea subsp. europaea]|uniref:Uncharacterized protein n=1 Tax=Olea europaea subsp. europaea TaxID=158383 RepID=A0A8S0VJ60_OLEEU|nr:Hypothetical predicted protein [Olea europaea subsp. europaea]
MLILVLELPLYVLEMMFFVQIMLLWYGHVDSSAGNAALGGGNTDFVAKNAVSSGENADNTNFVDGTSPAIGHSFEIRGPVPRLRQAPATESSLTSSLSYDQEVADDVGLVNLSGAHKFNGDLHLRLSIMEK